MKKIVSLVLAAALLLGTTACSALPAASEEPSASPENVGAGVVNPVSEMSADELLAATGIDLTTLSAYENVSFSTIAGDPIIAQAKFTKDGKDYTYRISMTDETTDISGMHYTWTTTEERDVSYNKATLSLSDEGAGVISWYDVVPGLSYSLSVSENADADELTALANTLFVPAQGDSDGDPMEGIVTGSGIETDLNGLLSEIRQNQPIGTAGSSMIAMSNAAAFANVVTAYETDLDELKSIVSAYAASLDAESFTTFTKQFNMVSGAFSQFNEDTVNDILESIGLELDTVQWDYDLISRYLSECSIAIAEVTPLEIAIPAAYQEVLDIYLENLSAGADWMTLEEAGLNPVVIYNTDNYRDTLGYMMMDVDGDSVLELLLGFTGENADTMILDMFTLNENQEARLVLRSAERDRYEFLGNSAFAEHGSSGAADSFDAYYTYAEGKLNELSAAPKNTDGILLDFIPFSELEDSADSEG